MKITKALLATFVVSLLVATFAIGARADELNRRSVIKFSQPVEIPGQVLPAGTYTIELFDTFSYRHIVRFYNADRTQLFATVLAIPNYRLEPTGDTVMTFMERPADAPSALKAWFYPNDKFGQEFVYPKARAVQLAQETHETIPAVQTEPAPIEELKSEPIVAETPQEKEVTVAEAFPTEPRPVEALTPTLPKTASPVPFVGLVGMLSVGLALALKRLMS
jgi:hypothetical protein